MNKLVLIATTALIGFGTFSAASADDCSGHDHDTGTAVGAVGGAAIGGLATHSIGGAVVGGVIGGFAGNAIARSGDCSASENHAAQAYDSGRTDQAYRDQQMSDADRARAYDAGRDQQAYQDQQRANDQGAHDAREDDGQ